MAAKKKAKAGKSAKGPKGKGKSKAKPKAKLESAPALPAAPAPPGVPSMAMLATAVPPPDVVIHARVGDTLTLSATVTNAVVPYAVSYDGKLKIFELVSTPSTFDVGGVGGHTIGWAFNELAASNWTHRLTARVNGGAEIVLLDGSSADKDEGFATGHATVVVA